MVSSSFGEKLIKFNKKLRGLLYNWTQQQQKNIFCGE